MGERVAVKECLSWLQTEELATRVCCAPAILVNFAHTCCVGYLGMVTCLDHGLGDLVKHWSRCRQIVRYD